MIEHFIGRESIRCLSIGNRPFVEQQFYGTIEIKWFMERLYGNKPLGQLLLLSDKEQTAFFIDSTENILIAQRAAELAKTMELRFCMGLFSNKFPDMDYRGSMKIAAVPGLWVNINIQDPSNKAKNLPSQVDAVNFLNSQSMKPDIIVNAGDELQAYWIFNEPFIVNSVATLDEIMKLSHDFQHKIIADGLHHGWQIENTSIITNFQRLPGTWNWTHNPPTPINILEFKKT